MFPRLSICIPTYNYGRFIRSALESVVHQREKMQIALEIVVLDGGSTDETPVIVSEFVASYSYIKYLRKEARGGIDADLAEAIRFCSGEYCWLLSADDRLSTGGLATVLNALDNNPTVVLGGRVRCDQVLNPLITESWWSDLTGTKEFRFRNIEDVKNYLSMVTSLGGTFAYMSSLILNRNSWSETKETRTMSNTCYMHVARIYAMLLKPGAVLKCVPTPIVDCRFGEDSFRDAGLIRRLILDYRGFDALIGTFADNDTVIRRAIASILRREHTLKTLMSSTATTSPNEDTRLLFYYLARFRYSLWERNMIKFGAFLVRRSNARQLRLANRP